MGGLGKEVNGLTIIQHIGAIGITAIKLEIPGLGCGITTQVGQHWRRLSQDQINNLGVETTPRRIKNDGTSTRQVALEGIQNITGDEVTSTGEIVLHRADSRLIHRGLVQLQADNAQPRLRQGQTDGSDPE